MGRFDTDKVARVGEVVAMDAQSGRLRRNLELMREAVLPKVMARRQLQKVMGNGDITEIIKGRRVRDFVEQLFHSAGAGSTMAEITIRYFVG